MSLKGIDLGAWQARLSVSKKNSLSSYNLAGMYVGAACHP